MKKLIVIMILLFPIIAESKQSHKLRKLPRPSISQSVSVSPSPSITPTTSPSVSMMPDVRYLN